MLISSNKSLKRSVFSYWDSLKAKGVIDLAFLTQAHYGENQDFVQSTCAALMPQIGYIRPETVSVYFRSYKAEIKRTIKEIQNIGQ